MLVFFMSIPYMVYQVFKHKEKNMKKIFFILALFFFNTVFAWGVPYEKDNLADRPEGEMAGSAREVFRQNIPPAARQLIGTPYEYGGNPLTTKATDNSYLFYAIYSQAAQAAGLKYYGYLPMKNLLQHTEKVEENQLKKGDLMVLDNNLAAMIYNIEKETGRLFLIYASEKRRQVTSFNSDNIVFSAYWLENLKGFYRLTDTMLNQS
jgi:hypothetical protein